MSRIVYNAFVFSRRPQGNIVNVYIDGYNFYYSINKRETLHLGWCNFSKLAGRLASRAFGEGWTLGAVKYYTSRVDEDTEMNPGEIERRNLWLAALEHGTGGKVLTVEGYHKPDRQKGRVEKRTDTNIAIGMIRDTLVPPPITTHAPKKGRDEQRPCDAVILMSGDDDFWPVVEMIGREYGKEVAVFRPHDDKRPLRENGWVKVDRVAIEDLERSRLDDVIERSSGPPITWAEYLSLKRSAARKRAPDLHEIVLEVGAEGGSITLLGEREAGDWQFQMETQETYDLSEEDVGVGENSAPIECVRTFHEAVAILDRYRWFGLQPLKVHPEFREAVLLAVRMRGGPTEETRWREKLKSLKPW